ncbi:hypothetical protein [uncultured Winogradskyella sp.]|uniref:hypothetical protein n=1 Tax=uncultured Winogradskyella sp. TaxID=395353 RepID=UPI00261BEF7A|nr:hypothetical protein [uncultured Winogradskyella sp.]
MNKEPMSILDITNEIVLDKINFAKGVNVLSLTQGFCFIRTNDGITSEFLKKVKPF